MQYDLMNGLAPILLRNTNLLWFIIKNPVAAIFTYGEHLGFLRLCVNDLYNRGLPFFFGVFLVAQLDLLSVVTFYFLVFFLYSGNTIFFVYGAVQSSTLMILYFYGTNSAFYEGLLSRPFMVLCGCMLKEKRISDGLQ